MKSAIIVAMVFITYITTLYVFLDNHISVLLYTIEDISRVVKRIEALHEPAAASTHTSPLPLFVNTKTTSSSTKITGGIQPHDNGHITVSPFPNRRTRSTRKMSSENLKKNHKSSTIATVTSPSYTDTK